MPTLSRTAVDRAALRREDDEWLAKAWETGKLLVVDALGRTTAREDGVPELVLIDAAGWQGDGPRLLLGEGEDGTTYWGTLGDPPKALGARTTIPWNDAALRGTLRFVSGVPSLVESLHPFIFKGFSKHEN